MPDRYAREVLMAMQADTWAEEFLTQLCPHVLSDAGVKGVALLKFGERCDGFKVTVRTLLEGIGARHIK
ncbi:hypothetical protein [uncultured Sulfitobacter sp.]|uniref:hypothetical protein n=1 Tax=uncultured Sulfitobacter sp. TaxID=191468 RepID=UPI0026282D52|nr:hypothetical protein [uncultured Sulfitobacter sp.]